MRIGARAVTPSRKIGERVKEKDGREQALPLPRFAVDRGRSVPGGIRVRQLRARFVAITEIGTR